jgi:hypothetical protein
MLFCYNTNTVTKRGTCGALCINFCAYYKPEKNEELACRGYLVVERLVRDGRRIPFERSGSRGAHAGTELLVNKVCAACDFRDDGCDFMNDRKAVPCGGLELLSQLLAQGVILPEDLE